MSAIDEYLDNVSQNSRDELERIRRLIAATVPDAEEAITYAMPGFKYKGKYLIAYAAFKDHLSLFPGGEAIEVLGDKLTDYKTSKGTVQFTLEQPLSDELIRELVAVRLANING